MASSKRKTLYFAVGSPDEYRSAVWRLWVHGDDVYLGARDVRWIKLSMHHSGIWRYAWTEESGLKTPGSADRVINRWSRPADFVPGWTQGPSLIVPNTGIRRPFKHRSQRSWMRFIGRQLRCLVTSITSQSCLLTVMRQLRVGSRSHDLATHGWGLLI